METGKIRSMTHRPTWEEMFPDLIISTEPLTQQDLDELRTSTLYEDRRTWIKLLRLQLEWKESRFQGPPGLRERMERLYAYFTARAIASQALTSITSIEKM